MKFAENKQKDEISRRSVLKWSAPTIVAVSLPVHAQMSVCTEAMPRIEVSAAPKCSGEPPVGEAVLTLFSDTPMVDVVIQSITVSGDGSEDSVTFMSLPATATDLVGVDVSWTGPASDAQTCLPISGIQITVEYTCLQRAETSTVVFDVSQELASSVA